MIQRCPICGRNRKQHRRVNIHGCYWPEDPADDGIEIDIIRFFRKYPDGQAVDWK